jgi:hypothetical protein
MIARVHSPRSAASQAPSEEEEGDVLGHCQPFVAAPSAAEMKVPLIGPFGAASITRGLCWRYLIADWSQRHLHLECVYLNTKQKRSWPGMRITAELHIDTYPVPDFSVTNEHHIHIPG